MMRAVMNESDRRARALRDRRSKPAVARQVASVVLVLVSIALTGCGKSEPPPDPLKGQRAILQKAKGLDDVMGGAAADMQKKIDEQESKLPTAGTVER